MNPVRDVVDVITEMRHLELEKSGGGIEDPLSMADQPLLLATTWRRYAQAQGSKALSMV